LPNPERTASSIDDCGHIALAIVAYAEKMKRRIAELEVQVALTSRVKIEGVTETEDAPPITAEQGAAEFVGIQKRDAN
jgi:hypothetical protein